MEGVDVAGVVVPGELVDALAHFVGRLVGEGDAQDVPRQNPQLVHQEREAVGEGPGLAGACPSDNTHPSLGGDDGLPLRIIQFVQEIHGRPSPLSLLIIIASRGRLCNSNAIF